MKRRMMKFAALGAAFGLALLPHSALADCQIIDPGCYIDDFAYKQWNQFALSIWELNRAGLVLARWLEDLRIWLTDSVFVDAFTTLTQPVKFAFYLALIIAWLIFVISFMVQNFIDLRWVDLRRAVRPILLAMFIFTVGGSLLKGTEYARLVGGTMLQQAASDAVQAVEAPRVPTENTSDMADASSSIYTATTTCGTPARTESAMLMNDYDARYLWANAEDIHCAHHSELPSEFYARYFPHGENITSQNGEVRKDAVALATQAVVRQATGVFMTTGAIIEQIVQMIFAAALALVWLGILLSLVFAIFVPTEELFSTQIKALFAVIRTSWIASFLLGLGLAVLQIVANSGDGFLVFICGQVLITVAIWQGKQALGAVNIALGAVSAATGSAPQAIGGIIGGWATSSALVAGMALKGGLGATLRTAGSTAAQHAGHNAGGNLLHASAGRMLSNHTANQLDNSTQEQRIAQDSKLGAPVAAWYERGLQAATGMSPITSVQHATGGQGGITRQAGRMLHRWATPARRNRAAALPGNAANAVAGAVTGGAASLAPIALSYRWMQRNALRNQPPRSSTPANVVNTASKPNALNGDLQNLQVELLDAPLIFQSPKPSPVRLGQVYTRSSSQPGAVPQTTTVVLQGTSKQDEANTSVQNAGSNAMAQPRTAPNPLAAQGPTTTMGATNPLVGGGSSAQASGARPQQNAKTEPHTPAASATAQPTTDNRQPTTVPLDAALGTPAPAALNPATSTRQPWKRSKRGGS